MIIKYIILFLISFAFSVDVSAQNVGNQTGLPLPRFASLKSDETNVRTGPGLRYPIKWVLVKKEMPIEIVNEYDQWRKIKDIQGDEGWVHMAVLSGKRTAIIQINGSVLTEKENATSTPVATMENGVLVSLKKCEKEICNVEVMGLEGFMSKINLWGIYQDESFE